MRIVVHDDHVEVVHPEELELGFMSLSANLAGAPDDRWPDIIDEHFRRAIAAVTTDTKDLERPTEEVLEHVYLRLSPADGIPIPLEYAVEIAPGLLQTLAYDRPDSIQFLNDDHVRLHGIEALYDAGLSNLSREVPDQCLQLDYDVFLLEGSEYVGSLVFVLPWVTQLVVDEPEPPDGVLVAMPARNLLLFHVIRDFDQARDALGEMARITAELHDESSHQVSPRVYWWRPGRLDSVGHHDANGLVTYAPDGFLSSLGA